MRLLQDKVEYVCSEYLEDVDVFYENGDFEFIQVKYYPNTSPNMKDYIGLKSELPKDVFYPDKKES